MHISDVHDYTPEPTNVAKQFLESVDSNKEKLKEAIEEIVADQFDYLEDYADEHISQVAAHRAEKFLQRVLDGDEDAAEALLADKNGVSRYNTTTEKPWAKLIHGKLFESDGVRLRRQIVEAHADLLRNERIKDLESVVEGLSHQVKKLQEDKERRYGP